MIKSSSSSCPSFLSIDIVLRAHPQVHALDHILHHLTSFLDVSNILSIAIAVQHQPLGSPSLVLLEHAANREAGKVRHWSSELLRSYRQYQFETALNIAAARGFVAGVHWLRCRYYPKGKFHGVERAALYGGQLQMLHYLYRECRHKMAEDIATDSQEAVAHAAATGRLDLVHWYCDTKGPYAIGWTVMDAAVAQNQMAVVQFLDSVVGNRCTRRGLEQAAFNGHVEVVTWLHQSRYYEIQSFRTVENAIAGGHLPIVQYVMDTVVLASTSWMHAALIAAIRYGQIQIMQWLHDRASQQATACARHFRVDISTRQLYTVARASLVQVHQRLIGTDRSGVVNTPNSLGRVGLSYLSEGPARV